MNPQRRQLEVTKVRATLCSLGLLLCAGCVVPRDCIVASKSTVLGLDISTDAAGVPHLRLGLVRYFHQVIPVATNVLHAPPYSADVDAGLGMSQTAKETFTIGK